MERQIRKKFGRKAEISEELNELLKVVSETYSHYDDDRYMLERSIELSSKELVENNQDLRLQKQELENTLEELQSTQKQLAESEKMATLSKELSEANSQLVQQQEETKAAYEELQTVHEDLQSAQAKLVQSEKMSSLGQLTAGVAHEINNPVNFVYGGVQALDFVLNDLFELIAEYQRVLTTNISQRARAEELQKVEEEWNISELRDDAKQMIADIKVGAERTSDIVRGLKNFSRSDGATWQQADLHEGLNSTLIILNSQIEKDIEVVKEYDEEVEPIECYAGQLNQVFMNVISNALQAMEGKGTLRVKTKNLPERIMVSVRDTGTGIKQEALSRIFDPFFTTKEIGKGTGLGLSISYGIVEKHQGSIEVKTQEGQGTEFLIYLPKNPPKD